MAIDLSPVAVAWWLAFCMRFNLDVPAEFAELALAGSAWCLLAYGIGLIVSHVHRQDHASREIRFGRISRALGLALVRAHEQRAAPCLEQFAQWLGADPRGLQFMFDQHRNPVYWQATRPGRWRLQPTSSLERGREAAYVTIGKGWP